MTPTWKSLGLYTGLIIREIARHGLISGSAVLYPQPGPGEEVGLSTCEEKPLLIGWVSRAFFPSVGDSPSPPPLLWGFLGFAVFFSLEFISLH